MSDRNLGAILFILDFTTRVQYCMVKWVNPTNLIKLVQLLCNKLEMLS